MNTRFNELSCTMRVKELVDENFQDYKKPAMLISSVSCDFKCLKELGMDIGICQNMKISKLPNKTVSVKSIFERYILNPITQAVILGGLEPLLQFGEVVSLIAYFRSHGCDDDFVIYTGYYPDEIGEEIKELKKFKNIIIKYGRFVPNSVSKYDKVLGVSLSSENQHAKKLS